jgi:hypothetical protein
VVYAFLDPDQPVRVENDAMFAWEDGDPRPTGANNNPNFVWNLVTMFRRDYPFIVGEQALEAAKGWNPRLFFQAIVLSQAMVNRTARFIALAETAANWGANTADANTLNGGAGKWVTASNDPTSPNYLAIKKSLEQAGINILLATNSVVQPEELMLVISPQLASQMSQTSEIHDYIEQSRYAAPALYGEIAGFAQNNFGLPPILYGYKVIVETAARVTSNQVSSGVYATAPGRAFIKSPTSAIICSRVGGIEGNYGSPSFSTFQRYYYKFDLAVENFADVKNKRYEGHVVDQFKEVLAAPQTGYLVTNCA